MQGGGIHNDVSIYDAERIHERAKMIGYGINARRDRFPDETPYDYAPLADEMDELLFDEAARAKIKDYNLLDLGI